MARGGRESERAASTTHSTTQQHRTDNGRRKHQAPAPAPAPAWGQLEWERAGSGAGGAPGSRHVPGPWDLTRSRDFPLRRSRTTLAPGFFLTVTLRNESSAVVQRDGQTPSRERTATMLFFLSCPVPQRPRPGTCGKEVLGGRCQVHPAWIWTSHSVCVWCLFGCSSHPPPQHPPALCHRLTRTVLPSRWPHCAGAALPPWARRGAGGVEGSTALAEASQPASIMGSVLRTDIWEKKRDDRRGVLGIELFSWCHGRPCFAVFPRGGRGKRVASLTRKVEVSVPRQSWVAAVTRVEVPGSQSSLLPVCWLGCAADGWSCCCVLVVVLVAALGSQERSMGPVSPRLSGGPRPA